MISAFRSLGETLRDSVMARLGVAMGLLTLLSFVSIVISTVIADNISGQANAINLSGSLRMMSYRMLSEAQQPARRSNVPDSVAQFERRIHALDRFISGRNTRDPASVAIRGILERWNDHIRPVIRAAASGEVDGLVQMAQDIPDFVQQIDEVVRLIEEDLEQKVRWLRATQFLLLAIIVLVGLVTSWMVHRQLVLPLIALRKAARTVTQGAFTARVDHTGGDELGQLGQAFNTMMDEIGSMYGQLEQKVADKTEALTRTNQSLELLYRTSQQLSASDLTLDTIQTVLRDIEAALNLGHSMICVSENGQLPAHPVISRLSDEETQRVCGQPDCATCFARTKMPLVAQSTTSDRIVVPVLSEAGGLRGTLPILLREPTALTTDQARIIETVGHHIGNALANMRRTEEKHRLAVLEERAVIARELHDSIAQSLSYLKIQVTRLEKCLDRPDEARVIAGELRQGLNAAYRELRELITTFRLRIDERGFNAALADTLEEFAGKLGFRPSLSTQLSGLALSANEEMHVIRIIREALGNIERHAQATEASIDIAVNEAYGVDIRIRDNGCGFNPGAVPPHHYGTSIMRDRASILQGRLDIQSTPGQGTEIRLHFQPQHYRSQEP